MSAYLPPTTAAARMGSVGVRQAATARDDKKFSPGIRANMRAADTNHPYLYANAVSNWDDDESARAHRDIPRS